MPLPLISAREPSALRSSIRTRASAVGSAGVARMTPSAPMPVCRSHRARATAASSGWEASGSSTTRKSLPRPWCLVRRMSGISLPDGERRACPFPPRRPPPPPRRSRASQQRRRVGDRLEPADPGIAAEPRRLTSGEAPGPTDRQVERLVERHPVGDVRRQLAVAEGLPGRARQAAGSASEAFDLGQEAAGHLPLVAGGDAVGHDGVRQAHAHQVEPARRVGPEPGSVGGERSAAARASPRGPGRPAAGSSAPCARRPWGRAS